MWLLPDALTFDRTLQFSEKRAYIRIRPHDNGKITATVDIPSRRPPKNVLLRLRHPQGAPIKSATVNGKPWNDFDAAKECVRLHGMKGAVSVVVSYS